MKKEAIEKINKELKAFKGGQKESLVSRPVADALIHFIGQDEEFAQAVVQTDKTLSDCLAVAMKGAGNGISDIEVYKKVVQFYFPGAGVNFSMTINLCASVENEAAEVPDQAPRKSKVLDINIDDLFW